MRNDLKAMDKKKRRSMMNDLKAMEMDMISDLPRPILHHILSSLPQNDVVKTCVLSKSWCYLWYGRPNVEFCKDDFFKGTVENFMSVLDQTLIRYDHQNLSIQEFILKMPDKTIDSVSAPFLEKWIPKIITRNKKGLETFHLCFHLSFYERKNSLYFDLPSEIFLCESLREIHLEVCKLSQISCSTEKVLFRHLQKLRLRQVKIEEGTFERIMSSSPLIEEVSLNECEGLRTIKVSNHNCSLKNFEFRGCYCGSYKDPPIEICNVSHIETIKIKSCRDWFEHHHNNLFTRLKSLYLSRVHLTTKSVHIFSCNFPCLEDLELSNCFDAFEAFEEIQLSSRSVKRLAIEADGDRIKVSIDAPNMFEFEYKGCELPSNISFTTTPNMWKKSKIGLRMTHLDDTKDLDVSEWLLKLDDLLKVFSSRSETSLHVLVFCECDSYRWNGTPYDSIQVVVKHLESCLDSQLCSDYSVWLEVESMWKKLIQSSDKSFVQKTKKL